MVIGVDRRRLHDRGLRTALGESRRLLVHPRAYAAAMHGSRERATAVVKEMLHEWGEI